MAEPRWRRRPEDRPQELLAAALQLFGEQGFAATRLTEVAKRAGVSKATVYLYFDSKEALLRQAVRAIEPILDFGDDLAQSWTGDTRGLLEALVSRWLVAFEEAGVGCVPKLILAEGNNFPELAGLYVEVVVQRGRTLFGQVLQRGIERGEVRADLDIEQAVHVFMAPVHYAQLHRHGLSAFDPEGPRLRAWVNAHVELFWRGIQA